MDVTTLRDIRRLLCGLLVVLTLSVAAASAQTSQAPAAAAPAEPAKDALGRDTPRGSVLGFLAAARKGDHALAVHYLNTTLTGKAAETLAQQLFVVLDTRLPARLTQVSATPEGSRENPLAPDEERVGEVHGPSGPIAIVMQRVKRPKAEPLWLFSTATLAAIPRAYADVSTDVTLPWAHRLLEWRIGTVRVFDWVALLLGLPAFYYLTVLVNRLLSPIAAGLGRRLFARAGDSLPNVLPAPVRLLLLSVASQWLFSRLPLSLMTRQALTNLAVVIAIVSLTWLVVLLNGEIERRLTLRLPPANFSGAVSLLRVGRRIVDVVIVLTGLFSVLGHFGIDVTPLLAGLGVGGIAVALAAQKTLENVIAGASLIFDQAVRVGDFLRVGTLEGTVEHIGLRSTRIRTVDRSVIRVPNGTIATMSLETLSARDKFWFHPVVGLRYETTTDQMRVVLDGIRSLLVRQPVIDGPSVRVRFKNLGAFSLDVEVFAYVLARDWPHFLEIQEDLLLRITEIVSAAGTGIAFPSQTMYVEQTAPAGAVDAATVR
jgi:MscS family membrane protein